MNEKKMTDNGIFHAISESDVKRFRQIVIDVMSDACDISTLDDNTYEGIGRLGEKQMHAALKHFICPDESCHEIKIDTFTDDADEGEKKKRARKFVADVLHENVIYEIQTSSFAPLRDKINWILKSTPYSVILIHPIIEDKWVNYIDGDGKISGHKKSPKHESVMSIGAELYCIKDFIPSDRFCLLLLAMDAQEYRTKSDKKYRRAEKYQTIPTSLKCSYIFKSTEDYKCFIPEALPEKFSVKQYSDATKIRGIDAYSTVNSLCALGLLEADGNIGRAAAYKRMF